MFREYEDKWLHLHDSHDEKLMEYNNQIVRLENELQFEHSRTSQSLYSVFNLKKV